MRTLNDIIPPSRRKEPGSLMNPTGKEPLNLSTNHPSRFPYMTLGAVALVIIVSVGVLFYFSVAKVEILPSTVSVAVQNSFIANKNTSDLPFQVITAQKVATQSVKANGTKTVDSSASGTITIYNTQKEAQSLLINTRFATTAGLIFKTDLPVTVPGGSQSKPGSIIAKVHADQTGSTYNIEPTSFVVFGFIGTPKATKVYGRSFTAMKGGASGNVPAVDTTLEIQTRKTLTTALASDLQASIKTQIPPGYILLPGAVTTTYHELASAPSATAGMAEIKEQGTVPAVVFQGAALAQAVASSVPNLKYQGEQLTFASTDNLLFATATLPDLDTETFSFTLAGTTALMYTVDPGRIAAAVAGKTRQAAEVAVSSYPEVKRAIIVLRPFWRQTLPQDPASISIVVADADASY